MASSFYSEGEWPCPRKARRSSGLIIRVVARRLTGVHCNLCRPEMSFGSRKRGHTDDGNFDPMAPDVSSRRSADIRQMPCRRPAHDRARPRSPRWSALLENSGALGMHRGSPCRGRLGRRTSAGLSSGRTAARFRMAHPLTAIARMCKWVQRSICCGAGRSHEQGAGA